MYYCNILNIQWIDLKSNEKIKFAGKGKKESTWSGYPQEMSNKQLRKYVDNSFAMKRIRKENDFKRKYKGKKYEKETDKLFAGENNNKRRRNKKRKKKKVLLQTNVYYANETDIIYGVRKNQREAKMPKSKIT